MAAKQGGTGKALNVDDACECPAQSSGKNGQAPLDH